MRRSLETMRRPAKALALACCCAILATRATALRVVGTLQDGSALAGAADVHLHPSSGVAFVAVGDLAAVAAVDVSVPAAPALESVFTHGALDGANCLFVEHLPGYFGHTHVFVASRVADAVAIVDASNPAEMAMKGYVQDPRALAGASSIVVHGGYAYVAARAARNLTVLDVSDASAPRVAKVVRLAAASCVKLFGSHLYIAQGDNSRLSIFDVSDAANPMQLGTIKDVRLKGAAFVHANTADSVAYVVMGKEGKGLALLNVEEPTFPKMLKVVTSEEDTIRPGGSRLNRGRQVLQGATELVAANATHLYAAAFNLIDRDGEMTAGGVVEVDVSDPSAPFDAPTMPRVTRFVAGRELAGVEAITIAHDGHLVVVSGSMAQLSVLEP